MNGSGEYSTVQCACRKRRRRSHAARIAVHRLASPRRRRHGPRQSDRPTPRRFGHEQQQRLHCTATALRRLLHSAAEVVVDLHLQEPGGRSGEGHDRRVASRRVDQSTARCSRRGQSSRAPTHPSGYARRSACVHSQGAVKRREGQSHTTLHPGASIPRASWRFRA